MNFEGKQPSIEDDLLWKTTFDGRQTYWLNFDQTLKVDSKIFLDFLITTTKPTTLMGFDTIKINLVY